ncbi:MAG: ABC transporter ATP-binding protein [Alphaproteobacteria bacterium]|nr:ABC transporter ATP-binding protein [Alphaproteobacteria bacterium]
MNAPLLEIRDLRVGFPIADRMALAVRDLSLDVMPGEAVGLVGESGSGKSVTALAAMRLVAHPGRILGGSIRLGGDDILALDERALRKVRGRRMAMVFQDPQTSLNPAFTIGQQLLDTINAHRSLTPREARAEALEALAMVGIPAPERRLNSYPHEFSGGMRQRALIAMAIACRPQLLIADEPTTALDVTVQAQVIALLRRLARDLNLAVLFISHNLELVAELCDRVVVMYGGMAMEAASVEALFSAPKHPYTRLLRQCVPRLEGGQERLLSIDGAPPVLGQMPPGCPFAQRCPDALARCRSDEPPSRQLDGHSVACWVAT